jgi:hypothetical protein
MSNKHDPAARFRGELHKLCSAPLHETGTLGIRHLRQRLTKAAQR